MHPIEQTSGEMLEIPRDDPFSSCAGRPLHSPSFSVSSQFGEGKRKPAEEHSMSPLDYLIAAKAIQRSTFITPKASDINQLPCGGLFSQGHRALETTQSCGNK